MERIFLLLAVLLYVGVASVVPADRFKEDHSDFTALAKNIYFEARGEPLAGQIAVGLVTLHRVKDARFPNTIAGVVYQGSRNGRSNMCQFSWTCDSKSDMPKRGRAWERAKSVARLLLAEGSLVADYTLGANHYHANYVEPAWAKRMKPTAVIGRHIFYRDN